MTTLTEIYEALAGTLAGIDGDLCAYDHVPGQIDPPAFIVMPPNIDYRQTMRAGVVRHDLEVILLVASFEADQQLHLFPYLDVTGTRSVRAAIDSDPTLGLADVDAHVMAARPLGLEEVASYGYWGAAFSLLVAYTNQG